MKTALFLYLLIITSLNVFVPPFLFGEERKPYNPGDWLFSLVLGSGPLLAYLYLTV